MNVQWDVTLTTKAEVSSTNHIKAINDETAGGASFEPVAQTFDTAL